MDLDARLSPHATLREALVTEHTEFLAEQQNPPPAVLVNLRRHFLDVWEPLRGLWGVTTISSGYRCAGLNKLVRGQPNSLHVEGLATDNHTHEMPLRQAMAAAIASAIPWDELIFEKGLWIHVQSVRHFGGPPRRRALMTFNGVEYEPYNPADPRVIEVTR